MDVWTPAEGEAQLLDWWRPLLIVARRLREDSFPGAVNIDEFDLMGRVDRPAKPAIWLYQYRATGGFFNIDGDGCTYRFTPYRRGPSRGRFTECAVDEAAWTAGVHIGDHGDEAIHDPYPEAAGAPTTAGTGARTANLARTATPRRAIRSRGYGIRRRGHLQLVR